MAEWGHWVRVTCYGSGSNGNALLIQSHQTSILVDSGVPVRLLRSGLKKAGVADGGLSAILISHEHHDHIRSATQISRYQPVPFFGTQGTIQTLRGRVETDWQRMRAGERFEIGDLGITPIGVSHDAEEPVGFCVENGQTRIAIFTDLGEPNSDVAAALRGATLIVLESNYDEQMLRVGPYPAHLKRRIRGPLGHLANDRCADLIASSIDDITTDVWLAHLSEKNNRPSIARSVTKSTLQSGASTPQITTLPRFGQTVTWDSEIVAQRPRQASLFRD